MDELVYLSRVAREHGYDMTRSADSGDCWRGLEKVLNYLKWFHRRMRRASCVDQVEMWRRYTVRYVEEVLSSEEVKWYLRSGYGVCGDWPDIVRLLYNLKEKLKEPVRNMGDATCVINTVKFYIGELNDYNWTL
jgi:hypothetical protein